MTRSLLVLLLLMGCASARAQLHFLDSVRTVWADTSRSWNDRTVALAYISFYDSAYAPAVAVQAALRDARVDTGSAIYHGQLGMAYFGTGLGASWLDHRDAAMRSTRHALAEFTRVGDRHNMARCTAAIGRGYMRMGELGQAIQHLQAAAKALDAFADTASMVLVLEDIAYTLALQGEYEKALTWCDKALTYLGENEPEDRFYILLRKAAIQVEVGDAEVVLGTLAEARAIVERGLATDYRGEILSITGEALVLKGDCATGLSELNSSLALSVGRVDRRDMLAYLYARISRAHLCAQEYDQALRSAKEGLSIAEEHHMGTEIMENLECLARAYEGKGDLRNALAFNKRYHALNDSLKGARSASVITSALLNADFERQQFADSLVNVQQRATAAGLLQKERTRRNILIGAGLFALVFGSISYRQRRRTQKALKRSDELLLNILPEEVAEELKEKGHAEAKHFDNVTILFTDFKGFTEASERLTPQELVEELNTCFKAFDHIITARGIEKIKTIGDAYMCAGGMPDPASSSAADVVHAALEMQAFVVARKTERDAQGKPFFEMRVGIHTGPVVAGIVGVMKFAYDIWGDTVNTASRMESSGEVGQVNISEATYALVKGETGLTFTSRGKVQAKGKGEMEMYFVERTTA